MLGIGWTASDYADRFDNFLRTSATRMGLTLDPAQDVIDAFPVALAELQAGKRDERARQAERRIAVNQELVAGEVARFSATVANYRNQANAKLQGKIAELQAAMRRGYPPEKAKRDYAQFLEATQKAYTVDIERARAAAMARLQGG